LRSKGGTEVACPVVSGGNRRQADGNPLLFPELFEIEKEKALCFAALLEY
jgi:hypothetical protein